MLEQIVTYKSLVIAIAVTTIPIIIFMVEVDTFWGLVSIAGVIGGLGVPYLIIYWKRTSKFQDMTGFLTRLTLMQIDEKIAILDGYIMDAPTWRPEKTASMTEKIASDIRAIVRIRNDILDQKIRLNERLIRLRNILRDNQRDTAVIEAVMGLLD